MNPFSCCIFGRISPPIHSNDQELSICERPINHNSQLTDTTHRCAPTTVNQPQHPFLQSQEVQVSYEKLVRVLADGNKNFSGYNFSGLNLTRIDFPKGCNFEDANFKGATISSSFLEHNFKNAYFEKVTLENRPPASITQRSTSHFFINEKKGFSANALRSHFRTQFYRLLSARHTDFSGYDFSYWTLAGIIFEEGCHFIGAKFLGANLLGVSLKGNFSKADFSGACLKDVKLGQANFRGANFSKCDLQCMYIASDLLNGRAMDIQYFVDFSKVNFTHANLAGVNLPCVNFTGTDFSYTICTQATLDSGKFDDACFRYTYLRLTSFKDACFQHADMSDIFVLGYNFPDVQMDNATLSLDKQKLAAHLSTSESRHRTCDHFANSSNGSVITAINSIPFRYLPIKVKLMNELAEVLLDRAILGDNIVAELYLPFISNGIFNESAYYDKTRNDNEYIRKLTDLTIQETFHQKNNPPVTSPFSKVLLQYIDHQISSLEETDWSEKNNTKLQTLLHSLSNVPDSKINVQAIGLKTKLLKEPFISPVVQEYINDNCTQIDAENIGRVEKRLKLTGLKIGQMVPVPEENLFFLSAEGGQAICMSQYYYMQWILNKRVLQENESNADNFFSYVRDPSSQSYTVQTVDKTSNILKVLAPWPCLKIPLEQKLKEGRYSEIWRLIFSKTTQEISSENKTTTANRVISLEENNTTRDYYNLFERARRQKFLNSEDKLTNDEEQLKLSEYFLPLYINSNENSHQQKLSPKHLHEVLEIYGLQGSSPRKKAFLWVKLAAEAAMHSSSYQFGTEDASPNALRNYAVRWLKQSQVEDLQLISEPTFNEWMQKLEGRDGAFECTALLSQTMFIELARLSREDAELTEIYQTIPRAWL